MVAYICTTKRRFAPTSLVRTLPFALATGIWMRYLNVQCAVKNSGLALSSKNFGLRNEYDRDIRSALDSNDVDEKARVAGLIDQLAELDSDLPKQIHENRRTLAKQIDRLANRDEN